MPKYAKSYTIRFFGDPLKTVVRRRGRKFVYLSPIDIGPVTVWPRALTQEEIEAYYVRGQAPEGGRTLHFRGEPFIPDATKSS